VSKEVTLGFFNFHFGENNILKNSFGEVDGQFFWVSFWQN
jgi:hypothetical protein